MNLKQQSWIVLAGQALVWLFTSSALIPAVNAKPQQEGKTMEVRATEFTFSPSTLYARPGETISVVMTNDGNVPHDMDFELPKGEVEIEDVEPGDTGRITFQVPEQEGSYTFYCSIDNHREMGMEGRLVVSEKGD